MEPAETYNLIEVFKDNVIYFHERISNNDNLSRSKVQIHFTYQNFAQESSRR